MKRLFENSHKWLLALALVALAFMACDPDENEPDDGVDPTERP